MLAVSVQVGIDHIPTGSINYFRMFNTWSIAAAKGFMTQGACMLVQILATKKKYFDVTIRNIARITTMSRGAAQNAMDNLVQLGLAEPVILGNKCIGYHMFFDRDPIVPGVKLVEDDPADTVLVGGPECEPPPSVGWSINRTMVAHNLDHGGPESGPQYKTPEDSSLRSSERLASVVPTSAKPVATITTAKDGQVGFGFADDQGVLSELDILKVMADIRKEDIGGDPEDHELRTMITGRIAFMTSPTYKGHPMVKGGKETAQANRDKVKSFCMRIICKSDFRWTSKRVDPVHRDRAENIKRQITELMRKTETYRLKDGSEVSLSTYSQIMLDLQTHRDQMIEDRIKIRPKAIPSRDWRQKLEERITLELVAKHVYGDAADAHLPSDEDRMEYRRQISALRSELSMMG